MNRRLSPSRCLLRRGGVAACLVLAHTSRWPILHGAFLAVVTLGLAAGLPGLAIDNRLEVWTRAEDEGWDPFLAQDFVAVVLSGIHAGDARQMEAEKKIAKRIEGIHGIEEVESLSAVLGRTGKPDLAALGDGARFAAGWFLAADGATPILRAWVCPGADRGRVVAEVERAAHETVPAASVAGPAAFNAALDQESRAESTRAFLLAFAACALVLALFYRSARSAAALLGAATFGALSAVGAAGWAGLRLNFLTLNVPAIAFVVGLALTIHPFDAWLEARRRMAGARALRQAVRRTFPGCALSAVTTVAGFASVAAGSVEAVREFGLLAAASVLVAAASNLAIFPIAARLAGRPQQPATGPAWKALAPALAWTLRRRELLTRATLLGLALTIPAAAAIEVDHQPLELLRATDPLRVACARLGDSVQGLAPIEYIIDLPGNWIEPRNLRLLSATASAMENASGVGPVLSIVEPVKLAASVLRGGSPGSYSLPTNDALLALATNSLRQVPASTRRLVSKDGRHARVVIPLNIVGGHAFADICSRLEQAAARNSLPMRPAGLIHRLMDAQASVLEAQVASLLLASAAISLFLGAALGNGAQALATLAVNLSPLALAAASLAAFRVSLDLSTAMVASIALGIAVDDTSHILWCFGEARGPSTARARAALAQAGAGILTKNTVVVAGFLVISTAPFPPVARFGALTAATLVLSLISHLFILPAWLAGTPLHTTSATARVRSPCPTLL